MIDGRSVPFYPEELPEIEVTTLEDLREERIIDIWREDQLPNFIITPPNYLEFQ